MDYQEKLTHTELMAGARHNLSGQWGLAIGGLLLLILCQSAAASAFFIGTILVGGAFELGGAIFAQNIARNQRASIEDIFAGFNQYASSLLAYVLLVLGVRVGAIFFIVPGVILALGWSQTFFILADNPEMKGVDALSESWEIMKGNKGDYFILLLRFIPWALLCLLTLGIGFLFLAPYLKVTQAKYYDNLIGKREELDLVDHLVAD